MELTEDDARAKVIELLDGMNQQRMDIWIFSGITSHVLRKPMVARLLFEELATRSHEVQRFWMGTCTCGCELL